MDDFILLLWIFWKANFFSHLVHYLQKIFKNLKDSLKKCLDKRKAMSRSGAAASTLPTCKYFEIMRFLHNKTSNLETHSNIVLLNWDSEIIASQEETHATMLSPVPIYSLPIPLTSTTKLLKHCYF